jgi:PAS domain-containing protein
MTVSDVTEQKPANEALKRAFDEIKKSEDHRLVIDTIPTLVWRIRSDGVLDFLNRRALDYTGLSLDQIWPRAFHPDDQKGMLQKWNAIRRSGKRGGFEARLRRFDGEYSWFCSKPLRCAMSRATLSNGTARLPTSRTASWPRTHFATASSVFATTRKQPPTGSGRADLIISSPAYRSTPMLLAWRPHACWA